MKKRLLIVAIALHLSSCNNHDTENNIQQVESKKNLIELTCTPEIPGAQQVYISIDSSEKSVVENGTKAEKVLIETGRIVYEVPSATKRYTVRIDRSSGKMEVQGPNETDLKLNYFCEPVKQKF